MSWRQRLRYAWLKFRYGPTLGHAWFALENFERHHCKPQRRRS